MSSLAAPRDAGAPASLIFPVDLTQLVDLTFSFLPDPSAGGRTMAVTSSSSRAIRPPAPPLRPVAENEIKIRRRAEGHVHVFSFL
ncbi:unnamed protein product [Urochloa humidicola]